MHRAAALASRGGSALERPPRRRFHTVTEEDGSQHNNYTHALVESHAAPASPVFAPTEADLAARSTLAFFLALLEGRASVDSSAFMSWGG